MFSSFQDPDLASRARALAALPGGAFLVDQLYLTLYPLLTTVPRWLFEAVRLDLLAGALGGVGGVLYLSMSARRKLREPGRRGGRAVLWLGLDLAGALLCGYLLFGMSVPTL